MAIQGLSRFVVRSGTKEEWAAVGTTEILALGELGYDSTNKLLKVGDGTTVWNSLPTIATYDSNVTMDSIDQGTSYKKLAAADADNVTNHTLVDYIIDATTASKGKVQLAVDGGTTAGTVVQANDSRLSNSRTPMAHASSHGTGQADEVTPGAIGAYTQVEVNGLLTDHSAAITGIHGVTNPTGLDAANRMTWSDTDKTIEFPLNDDVTLQIGQEQVVRVVNKTAALIPNGSVVRISGAQGQRPTIELAQADSAAHVQGTIGLTTQDIDVDDQGFVTTHGLVRGTPFISSLVPGDDLYLSHTTPGAYTRTKPDRPYRVVSLGTCVNTTGSSSADIFVSVRRTSELSDLGEVWLNQSGSEPPSNGQVLAFDGTYWENQDNPAIAHAATVSGTVHGLILADVGKKPTTSSGVGEFKAWAGSAGAAVDLPSNGTTWAYSFLQMKTDGTLYAAEPTRIGIGNAGATIGTARTGYMYTGWVYRVS